MIFAIHWTKLKRFPKVPRSPLLYPHRSILTVWSPWKLNRFRKLSHRAISYQFYFIDRKLHIVGPYYSVCCYNCYSPRLWEISDCFCLITVALIHWDLLSFFGATPTPFWNLVKRAVAVMLKSDCAIGMGIITLGLRFVFFVQIVIKLCFKKRPIGPSLNEIEITAQRSRGLYALCKNVNFTGVFPALLAFMRLTVAWTMEVGMRFWGSPTCGWKLLELTDAKVYYGLTVVILSNVGLIYRECRPTSTTMEEAFFLTRLVFASTLFERGCKLAILCA